jgi:threonine dehydrogenase-like Zn-dependent dehydrogenase
MTGCRLQVAARHDSQRTLLVNEGIEVISEGEIPFQKMDIVVEASGSPGGFASARQAVRARGSLILKSTYAGDVPVNLSSLVVDEITLVGSRCGPFEPALRLLANKRLDPRPLISARFPLSQGPAAFEQAARPGVLKVLLEMEH